MLSWNAISEKERNFFLKFQQLEARVREAAPHRKTMLTIPQLCQMMQGEVDERHFPAMLLGHIYPTLSQKLGRLTRQVDTLLHHDELFQQFLDAYQLYAQYVNAVYALDKKFKDAEGSSLLRKAAQNAQPLGLSSFVRQFVVWCLPSCGPFDYEKMSQHIIHALHIPVAFELLNTKLLDYYGFQCHVNAVDKCLFEKNQSNQPSDEASPLCFSTLMNNVGLETRLDVFVPELLAVIIPCEKNDIQSMRLYLEETLNKPRAFSRLNQTLKKLKAIYDENAKQNSLTPNAVWTRDFHPFLMDYLAHHQRGYAPPLEREVSIIVNSCRALFHETLSLHNQTLQQGFQPLAVDDVPPVTAGNGLDVFQNMSPSATRAPLMRSRSLSTALCAMGRTVSDLSLSPEHMSDEQGVSVYSSGCGDASDKAPGETPYGTPRSDDFARLA